MIEPRNNCYEWLSETCLGMYAEGYGSDDSAINERADKARQVWELLTELDLATPPNWLVAVWRVAELSEDEREHCMTVLIDDQKARA